MSDSREFNSCSKSLVRTTLSLHRSSLQTRETACSHKSRVNLRCTHVVSHAIDEYWLRDCTPPAWNSHKGHASRNPDTHARVYYCTTGFHTAGFIKPVIVSTTVNASVKSNAPTASIGTHSPTRRCAHGAGGDGKQDSELIWGRVRLRGLH